VPRTRNPKVTIKRVKTSLGWVYRIYIDGKYGRRFKAGVRSRGRKANADDLRETKRRGVPSRPKPTRKRSR